MAILITGGCGLVGLHTAKAFRRLGEHVVCVDVREPSALALAIAGEPGPAFMRGDVCDTAMLTALCTRHAVHTIVHAAALVNETSMRADPLRGIGTNVMGTAAVLEAARLHGVRRVVYTSSGTIYGRRTDNAPIAEDEVRPEHLYAETKYMSERLIAKYVELYDVDAVIVRISSAYGPGKPWKPDRYPLQRLCRAAIEGAECALEEGGDYTRDYTYVPDVAAGVVLAARAAVQSGTICNIAAGRTYTLVDVADALKALVPGARLSVGKGMFEGDYALRGSMRGPLSIERARRALGFAPAFTLQDGLADYLAFLRAHPDAMRTN